MKLNFNCHANLFYNDGNSPIVNIDIRHMIEQEVHMRCRSPEYHALR